MSRMKDEYYKWVVRMEDKARLVELELVDARKLSVIQRERKYGFLSISLLERKLEEIKRELEHEHERA